MPLQVAVRVDPEMRGDAGALDVGLERAQLVRQILGQHRHDPVGEIDRVAALARGVVERVFGVHVPRHVGDGDERVPGAVLAGIGLGPDRIVEIARVGAVDGDERNGAQVLAAGERHRPRLRGEIERGLRKLGRDAVRVDRDQAEGARIGAVADALDDLRFGQAEAVLRQNLGEHDLAVARAQIVAARDAEFVAHLAVGRLDAAALAIAAIDAEDAVALFLGDGANDARFPAVGALAIAHDRALAHGKGRRARLGEDGNVGRLEPSGPGERPAAHLAVEVDIGDGEDADLGKARRRACRSLRSAVCRAPIRRARGPFACAWALAPWHDPAFLSRPSSSPPARRGGRPPRQASVLRDRCRWARWR